MELHHSKHHNTYVTSYNTQIEKLQEAQQKGDIQAQIAIQPLINFHGGTRVRNPPLSFSLSLPTYLARSPTKYASCKTKEKLTPAIFFPCRWTHKPHTLLGESRAQIPRRRRTTQRQPLQSHRRILRLIRQAQVPIQRCSGGDSRFGLGMVGTGYPHWCDPDQDICEPGPRGGSVPSHFGH